MNISMPETMSDKAEFSVEMPIMDYITNSHLLMDPPRDSIHVSSHRMPSTYTGSEDMKHISHVLSRRLFIKQGLASMLVRIAAMGKPHR